MPERIDLDAAVAPSRRPIDAGWSKRRKTLVGVAAGAVAVIALGAGVWLLLDRRPPPLPTTMTEAVAVLNSPKFERLSPERRNQYTAEARRLLNELPEEERRAMRGDEDTRDAMRALFQQTFEEVVLRYARGEDMEDVRNDMGLPGRGMRPGGRPGGDRNGEGRNGGGGEGRPGGERGDGERPSREDRAARMRSRMANFFQEGNAQLGALRGAMMRQMRQQQEQSGRGQSRS